jgi:hypothetical protein
MDIVVNSIFPEKKPLKNSKNKIKRHNLLKVKYTFYLIIFADIG